MRFVSLPRRSCGVDTGVIHDLVMSMARIRPSALFKVHSTAVLVVLPLLLLEGLRRCFRYRDDHVPASRLPAVRCGVVADLHHGLDPGTNRLCTDGWRMRDKKIRQLSG